MENDDINLVKPYIEAGSNIAGGITGGVLGFLLGDVQGAVYGATAGGIITGTLKTLGDIAHRTLSNREIIRVGAAASFAIDKIKTRLEAGERPRNDGFFPEPENESRSDAEEVLEGVLLKSKNEHEEKKIRIIANIFANMAFYSEISTGEANHTLQVAQNMTYRQMCFLALFERKKEFSEVSLADRESDVEDNSPIISDLSALQEIFQLYTSGLVAHILKDSNNNIGFSNSQIVVNNTYLALTILDDVVPNKMILTDLGKRYYSIMNLSEIPKEDLEKAAITLSK